MNPIIPKIIELQKEVLSNFHNRKMEEIKNVLDAETWNKIDVPDEMIRFIIERRGEAARIAGIKLENPEIIATGSLLIFYKAIYEYIKMSEELQISVESALRLVECLKFFNSRTYELIVEAKAVPQKLARVTSKHLALSVQGLTFILQELPYVENRLLSKNKDFSDIISSEFKTIRIDYTSHLKSIYDKLCQIIIIRVTENCEKALIDAKLDTIISPSQIDKDYYLKQITTDLISMHSILQTILNSNQIFEVFNTILQALSNSLVSLYSRININNYIPAQRIKNDTGQLLLTLREKFNNVLLEPLEDLEDRLQKFINEKCELHLKT